MSSTPPPLCRRSSALIPSVGDPGLGGVNVMLQMGDMAGALGGISTDIDTLWNYLDGLRANFNNSVGQAIGFDADVAIPITDSLAPGGITLTSTFKQYGPLRLMDLKVTLATPRPFNAIGYFITWRATGEIPEDDFTGALLVKIPIVSGVAQNTIVELKGIPAKNLDVSAISYGAIGQGGPQRLASITPAPIPATPVLTGTALTGGAKLTWTGAGGTGYGFAKLERADDADFTTNVVLIADVPWPKALEYDFPVGSGVSRSYRVRTRFNLGDGNLSTETPNSNVVTVTPP